MFRLAISFLIFASPALAQTMTTAAEVKPILQATKASWIAVREWEGQDLIYFTQILSWRCGVDEILFAVNGGAAQSFPAEPCYEDTAQPNAIKAEDVLPYAVAPLGSVQSVAVSLLFDDGTIEGANFERSDVLMP
ncbi:MAG: hypothetical protein AAGK37_10425 [Pseudomonadota bacterium]